MIVLGTIRNSFRLLPLVRHASDLSLEDIVFTAKFTDRQQAKVLETLNGSNAKELSRFRITHGRIKSLESWKSKKGPFKNLSEILEVDGLGVSVLETLCESVLNADELDAPVKKSPRGKRQMVMPILFSDDAKMLNSAIGIHLSSTGISWAKISKENNLITDWNHHDFIDLPKKVLPMDTFNLAVKIVHAIPPSDMYIFESVQKNMSQNASHVQLLELSSMLLALINTSTRHNVSMNAESGIPSYKNKVYYLKNTLPARLFGTLVGGERVCTSGIISKLLENNVLLPCSSVNFDERLVEEYKAKPKSSMDCLGKALLLIVTFMDLIVYKNINSLAAIQPNRK